MMDANLVFHKTEKGKQEIATRVNNLNHALRYVLILVDGKCPVSAIRDKGAKLTNIDLALDHLAKEHFIDLQQEVTAAPSNANTDNPKREIINMTRSLLGAQATPVIKKLEGAGETLDELTEITQTCKRIIKLAISESKADEFVRRSQEIIYSSQLHLTGAI